MRMATAWHCETPNPDEEQLKAEFEAETRIEESAYAEEDAHARRKQSEMEPLLRATGLTAQDIEERNRQGKTESRKSLQKAESLLSLPSVDIEALHSRDLEVARDVAEHPYPSWSGYIWNASYGGWWSNWNGDGEEVPYTAVATGSRRIDSRAQAWGEGWWDGDYSRTHGYLAFKFNPPYWGHLHVYVYPWAHGYYSLYSDDKWYNSAYSRAEFDTWVQVHQNTWRSRQYARRFTMAGDELHPTRWGRIDKQYSQTYCTNVGKGDTVTIRVGTQLYCYGRSSHSHSKLDLLSGSGNYVYVPYVYWYLHT